MSLAHWQIFLLILIHYLLFKLWLLLSSVHLKEKWNQSSLNIPLHHLFFFFFGVCIVGSTPEIQIGNSFR